MHKRLTHENQLIYHIIRIKQKNTIFLVDAEKAFDEI